MNTDNEFEFKEDDEIDNTYYTKDRVWAVIETTNGDFLMLYKKDKIGYNFTGFSVNRCDWAEIENYIRNHTT